MAHGEWPMADPSSPEPVDRLEALEAIEALEPQWIDRGDQISAVVEACRASGRIALDTEADSLHSYFHKVCLVQITTGPGSGHGLASHFLIDPLAIEAEALEPLWQVVGDPAIPVLMHGADYDVRILDRDFGAHITGLLDTQIMAQLLGEPRTGLAALLEGELEVILDKRHQRADWGRRPLPEGMRSYAAADTAFLEALVARLKARLEALGRWGWLVEECRRLEEVRFQEPEEDPLAFERIKTASRLKGEARDRCFTLHAWREDQAKHRDVPPFRVLGNQQILALASEPPESLDELAEVRGVPAGLVRRSGKAVLRLLSEPQPAPPRRRSRARKQLDPRARRRVEQLQQVREGRAAELGIEAGLLLPKAVAVAIATLEPPPRRPEQLEERGLTGWRLDELGDALTRALQQP